MKLCNFCSTVKPEGDFPWKKKDVKRASKCKACMAEYSKAHYERNKKARGEQVRARSKKLEEEHKQLVADALDGQVCVSCGGTDTLWALTPDGELSVREMLRDGVGRDRFVAVLAQAVPTCQVCVGRESQEKRGIVFDARLSDVAWLRAQYVDQGRSTAKIGRELACSPNTVASRLKHAGVELREPAPIRLIELYDPLWMFDRMIVQAMTQTEVATELGCDASAVGRAIKRDETVGQMLADHGWFPGHRITWVAGFESLFVLVDGEHQRVACGDNCELHPTGDGVVAAA